MTRWVQCPDCQGSGKTKDGKVCSRCKGKLCIAVDIEPKKVVEKVINE